MWSGRASVEGPEIRNRRLSYTRVGQYESVYSPFERGSSETGRSGYSLQNARKRNSRAALRPTSVKPGEDARQGYSARMLDEDSRRGASLRSPGNRASRKRGERCRSEGVSTPIRFYTCSVQRRSETRRAASVTRLFPDNCFKGSNPAARRDVYINLPRFVLYYR